MASLLLAGLNGLRTLAEVGAKKLEELDQASLEADTKNTIDLDKARAQFEKVNARLELLANAIDQLQQRVSNLEAQVGQIRAARSTPELPPKPRR